ncbi:MAG: hypothetical protein K8E66_12220, partial [Phycisphaerales bacterium]|nr:hypothetical protein [Phycisphaerales bacterium]
IRTTVDGADLDPPAIQQNYDGINRTIHLVGQIPLNELYSQTPAELAPILIDRLGTLNECVPGNTVDPLLIEVEIVAMSLVGNQMPLGQILAFDPGSEPFWASLDTLRALGVGIPDPSADPGEVAARLAAFQGLVEPGGEVTLRVSDLFFKNAKEVTLAVMTKLNDAKSSGLLASVLCDNDRCCAAGTGPLGTDLCNAHTKFCNRPPPSRAFCSIASDPCP